MRIPEARGAPVSLGLPVRAAERGRVIGAPVHAHIPQGHCRTHACWQRVSERRHREFWHHRFLSLSPGDRAWARCIAHYETYGTPWSRKASVNTGNGYYGAVQFSMPTARAAGFHRRPDLTTLDEQLYRAVKWRNRAGSSQWSTSRYCG